MKAVILAGGAGTRLQPLTTELPKPMVSLLGRPVLEHILLLLRRHQVTEAAVTLHYHPEAITGYFGDGTMIFKAILMCLLDYLLAYTMMGLGGVFRDKIKNPGTSLMCGSLVALGARYLSHILSGYLLFSGWADWFFTQDGFPTWGAKLVESLSPTALGWVYSIVYNGFYMVPELILTAIAAQLIARIPKIVVKVD